ncbi:MAG TPA: hypothetical protein PLR32_00020 [candidate division Zixibacteria bacterium]|mgnify:CR=1 FL=1|nr:hypothetical protein [candidate division Zixibacteria bacterium]
MTELVFSAGVIVGTPAALDALEFAEVNPAALLVRHLSGDWGELDAEDRAANDAALRGGGRLFSAYDLPTGARVWIITEADRSSTTVLLPEDY